MGAQAMADTPRESAYAAKKRAILAGTRPAFEFVSERPAKHSRITEPINRRIIASRKPPADSKDAQEVEGTVVKKTKHNAYLETPGFGTVFISGYVLERITTEAKRGWRISCKIRYDPEHGNYKAVHILSAEPPR